MNRMRRSSTRKHSTLQRNLVPINPWNFAMRKTVLNYSMERICPLDSATNPLKNCSLVDSFDITLFLRWLTLSTLYIRKGLGFTAYDIQVQRVPE